MSAAGPEAGHPRSGAYLGWGGVVAGTLGTVCKFLGFAPLLTGIIGYCPAYRLLGFRTRKA